MRFFYSIQTNLRMADTEDVRDALEVSQARRSNNWKWSKDKNMMMSFSIPNSWYFNPAFSKGLENCDEDEKKAFLAAFKKSFPKLTT